MSQKSNGWKGIPQTEDPREWLLAVMNCEEIEMEHRIEAAAALAGVETSDGDDE